MNGHFIFIYDTYLFFTSLFYIFSTCFGMVTLNNFIFFSLGDPWYRAYLWVSFFLITTFLYVILKQSIVCIKLWGIMCFSLVSMLDFMGQNLTPLKSRLSKLQSWHQNFSCLVGPNEHFYTTCLLSARTSHGTTFTPRLKKRLLLHWSQFIVGATKNKSLMTDLHKMVYGQP